MLLCTLRTIRGAIARGLQKFVTKLVHKYKEVSFKILQAYTSCNSINEPVEFKRNFLVLIDELSDKHLHLERSKKKVCTYVIALLSSVRARN